MPTNRPNTPSVNKRHDPTSIIDRLVSLLSHLLNVLSFIFIWISRGAVAECYFDFRGIVNIISGGTRHCNESSAYNA